MKKKKMYNIDVLLSAHAFNRYLAHRGIVGMIQIAVNPNSVEYDERYFVAREIDMRNKRLTVIPNDESEEYKAFRKEMGVKHRYDVLNAEMNAEALVIYEKLQEEGIVGVASMETGHGEMTTYDARYFCQHPRRGCSKIVIYPKVSSDVYQEMIRDIGVMNPRFELDAGPGPDASSFRAFLGDNGIIGFQMRETSKGEVTIYDEEYFSVWLNGSGDHVSKILLSKSGTNTYEEWRKLEDE